MQDLKDMTLDVHYENYRAKYITERMSKRQSDRREGVGTGAYVIHFENNLLILFIHILSFSHP